MATLQQSTVQIRDIPIRDITTSTDTQARVQLRDATIREYAELVADGTAFPPVVVFTDGSSYWLADGFHRHAAHKLAGQETIRAIVKLGSKRDATRYACQANGKHGLPMSVADKRRAVELMLSDPEVAESLADRDDDTWTQRKLARHCGVSHTFVANLIKERDQHGNVASHAKLTAGPAAAPERFVDDVLDQEDAPEQPHVRVTTTFATPRPQYTSPPRSAPPVHYERRAAPPRPAVPVRAIPTGMTILIAWSYADAEGQQIEGEISLRELDEAPESVRAALAAALGVQ